MTGAAFSRRQPPTRWSTCCGRCGSDDEQSEKLLTRAHPLFARLGRIEQSAAHEIAMVCNYGREAVEEFKAKPFLLSSLGFSIIGILLAYIRSIEVRPGKVFR